MVSNVDGGPVDAIVVLYDAIKMSESMKSVSEIKRRGKEARLSLLMQTGLAKCTYVCLKFQQASVAKFSTGCKCPGTR